MLFVSKIFLRPQIASHRELWPDYKTAIAARLFHKHVNVDCIIVIQLDHKTKHYDKF